MKPATVHGFVVSLNDSTTTSLRNQQMFVTTDLIFFIHKITDHSIVINLLGIGDFILNEKEKIRSKHAVYRSAGTMNQILS